MVAALLGPSQVRADFVAWTYNWGRSPIAVAADSPGTGGITLTDESTLHASGSSDIVATNLRTFSSATRTNPDRFTNQTYSLNLFLKDDVSGQSTTLTFSGKFNGTLTAFNANIANTFTGDTTKTVHLGDHDYTVVLGSYAPPGPPTAVNAGSITAHIAVDEPADTGGGGTPVPPPSDAPEPSTMVLASLGLSMLSLTGWRKRRLAK